jgi:hypothetical protein
MRSSLDDVQAAQSRDDERSGRDGAYIGSESADQFQMSVSDCPMCRDLIEYAGLSIKHHLAAMADLAAAVQKNEGHQEISTLEDAVRRQSLERENAVARYETHLAEHGTRVMTAGSCPAPS